MIRLMENGLSRILITVFTFFAVMTSFYFAAVEPLRIVSFSVGRTGSEGERIGRVIPSPADEPAFFIKTKDNQVPSMRAGFQRIFSPGGSWGLSSSLCRSSFGSTLNVNPTQVKNSILLKLRI
ncbi:MAG: hypothetical protein LBP20_08975 [Treponema sp.]|jgi:hypothetical protein|nr:hypothetical protein [Treponema sp.]